MHPKLVVLSACDVGRGKVVAGEGVLGMVRAFLAARARKLLVSVWAADDKATAELMKHFYAERSKAGVSDQQALARAQEKVRSQAPWRHPYYWAGWVFWGVD